MNKMSFLEEMGFISERRVGESMKAVPVKELEHLCETRKPPQPFDESLKRARGEAIKVIAEIKYASPSKGPLKSNGNIECYASRYEAGGASAISVLTEPTRFSGSLDYLCRASAAASLPVLRKDFIVNEYQILEARANGASSVLLIVALLSPKKLKSLTAFSRQAEMEPLVETRDLCEVEEALASGARVIGINNRDLISMKVDIKTTLNIASRVPRGIVLVSESGFRTRKDVMEVENCGVSAILVGEALMSARNPERLIGQIRGACDNENKNRQQKNCQV